MDLRTPLGLLFALLGLLLVGYGLAGDPSVYTASLNINVNVWAGSAMVLFGAWMLFLSRRGGRASPSE